MTSSLVQKRLPHTLVRPSYQTKKPKRSPFHVGLVRPWSSCWTNLPHAHCSRNSLGCLFDPYRLDIREFPNPVGSQFSPMPRPFHSPKGYTGIGSYHTIYENHSRFQVIDEAFALILVVRPGARPQSKPAVVRNSNRVIRVFSPEHARHRTE